MQFFECSDQSNDCATGVWNPLGTVPAPGPYSVSWSIPAADGNHALAAVATDNAGHPATAIRNVDVDRTAPSTSDPHKARQIRPTGGPVVHVHSSEPGSTFECSIDGGVVRPVHEPAQRRGPHRQRPHLRRARDGRGRQHRRDARHLDVASRHERADRHAEQPRRQHPADGHADLDRDGSARKRLSSGLHRSRTSTPRTGRPGPRSAPSTRHRSTTSSGTRTGVTDGVYQLRIVVSDVAGNTTTSSTVPNVRIDNTVPTTSQNDPGQYLRATKTLTGSAADSGSGIDHVDFQRAPTGGGSWTTIATDSTPRRRLPGQLRHDERVRRSLRLPDGCVRRRREPGSRDAGHRPSRRQHRADRDHQQPRPVSARRRQPHVCPPAIRAARTPPAS